MMSKHFDVHHFSENPTPAGGKVLFGIGELVTLEDETLPVVLIQVTDQKGEKIVDAALSKDAFNVFLETMQQTLNDIIESASE